MKGTISRLFAALSHQSSRKHVQLMSSYDLPLEYSTGARLLYFHRIIERTRDIDGDIVECGVGRGNSLATIAIIVKALKNNKNIWGFDSFQGFPEPSEQDGSRAKELFDTGWAIDRNYVMQLLAKVLQDPLFLASQITLVDGFFKETVLLYPGKISLLHLDVDLYESYKTCLEALYPRLSPGGIVTFDEYIRERPRFPGASLAINEFFDGQGVEFQKDAVYGKYFIVKP